MVRSVASGRARRHAQQAETKGGARSAQRIEWTSAELEVAARRDLTAIQIARMLGRSRYAVDRKRQLMKHDPKTARLAGLDNELARLAAPETINVAPRYER